MNRRQLKHIGRKRFDEQQEEQDEECPEDLGGFLARPPSSESAPSAVNGSDGDALLFKGREGVHRRPKRRLMLQLPRKKVDHDRLDGDESTLAMLRALTELAALLHDFDRPGR